MRRAAFLAGSAAAAAAGLPRLVRAAGTRLPMQVENNRIYATFGFAGANGRVVDLRADIDTGGGAIVLARSAVERLGLTPHDEPHLPRGMQVCDLHEIRAGALRIPVTFAATTTGPSEVFHPGASSPAFVPGAVLRDRVLTFDYTDGALGFDEVPLESAAALAVQVATRSSFPRIELEIDGERMGFLLDTGASFTMLSQAVIDRLHAKHPDWTYVAGAYGPANMIGKGDLAAHMLRVPSARWGTFEIAPLTVVSRAAGVFEKYMSAAMSAPIVGSLAGNVLRNFALRLDYRASALQARYAPRPWEQEFTMVPLIVQARPDGTYAIAGGTASSGIAGAQLQAVDGASVAGLSLYGVQNLLRGAAGSAHVVRVGDESAARDVRLTVEQIL